MATIINGNRVYRWLDLWRVESTDGSWDGYELYDTYQEAVEAARRDDEWEED